MDRKQQPEMWFVLLVSFSLGITAQTECSVEWHGLKIKVYTKMLEGFWDWCCEHAVSSTRNLLLMTVASWRSGKDGGHAWAHLWCRKYLSSCPWRPRSSRGGCRAPHGLARMREGGRDKHWLSWTGSHSLDQCLKCTCTVSAPPEL